MKSISKFCTVTIALISALVAGNALAQTTILPITSKSDLSTYAVEQAAWVSVGIGTSVPAGNNAGAFVPVDKSVSGVPSFKSTIGTIVKQDLSIADVNPNDPLFAYIYVYNADYDLLFMGWHQFNLVNGKGGYTMPQDYGEILIDLADNIPIKIPGVQSAMVDLLNGSGQSGPSYSLTVQNDKVYFPRQLAEQNILLEAYVGSGWQFWDSADGSTVSPEKYAEDFDPSFDGILTYTDEDFIVTLTTQNGVGENMTVEYTSTIAQTVFPTFKTSEGKSPQKILMRQSGTSEWNVVVGRVPVGVGVYYFVPVWDASSLTEPSDPWYPPSNGGGKG